MSYSWVNKPAFQGIFQRLKNLCSIYPLRGLILSSLFLQGTLAWSQTTYFPPVNGDDWEVVSPTDLNWDTSRIAPLLDFLEAENTRAFIVLKDGKMVLEEYFNGFEKDDSWYWASAGKSLTAFAVGLARQQGLLSLDDPVSDYLGRWTECDEPDENKLTIWHQLTMTTGFETNGISLDCTADSCLVCRHEPGSRWFYHNAPYTLLDGVLQGASGLSLNVFLQRNIFRQTGMAGLFIQTGDNNVFYSKPRSMARFGLLVQNRGTWDGRLILEDEAYFDAMTTPSQTLNPSYGYLWWLNGQSSYKLPGLEVSVPGPLMRDAPQDLIAALGKNGQIINVVPSQNLVLIRMGDSSDDFPIGHLLNNRIWQFMNEILPESSATSIHQSVDTYVRVYPNPGVDAYYFDTPVHPEKVIVFNSMGTPVLVQHSGSANGSVFLNGLPPGIYTFFAVWPDGKVSATRVSHQSGF
jgi:CubicO group peptidase (beta-lactamase class C family)